jgi:tRNA threonylcarbamoyladenosine biosynthesis protein TsaB
MNLLAIETSTEQCSVALSLDGVEHVSETHAGQRHSDMLLDMVHALCAQHGIALKDIDGFAFGAGPGSFTGLRIACGVVQGMAFGLGKQVVGVTSLETLAEQTGAQRVVSALDARMNETYLAAYERQGDSWRIVIEPCLCDAQRLPELEGAGWTAIGSAFDHHAYVREHYAQQLGSTLNDRLPSAREIARVAVRAFQAGRQVEPDFAAPLYIRDKVAMTIEERAQLRKHKAAGEGGILGS